ncbi:MAG: helix-turn-helix transcriptional regulator [Novosphingobium sp.]
MTVAGDVFDNPLVELTAKQREVLDLLIQHKTSKEISRLLGISPHTVDQRIMLARAKLGVATRGEVAQAYRRLVETYEQPVYEISHIGFPPLPRDDARQDDTAVPADEPEGVQQPSLTETGTTAGPMSGMPALTREGEGKAARNDGIADYRVLPEMFDGPNGTLVRLSFIGGLTVFLILIVLGGLSMFAQLGTLLDT